MRIVWTNEALDDIQQIINYIASDNKRAALKVADNIFATIDNLLTPNPHLGRLGRVKAVCVPIIYHCLQHHQRADYYSGHSSLISFVAGVF